MISKQKTIKRLFQVILLLTSLSSCHEEVYLPRAILSEYNYYISFNNVQLGIDTAACFILYPIESLDIQELEVKIYSEGAKVVEIEGKAIDRKGIYHFEEISFTREYEIKIELPSEEIKTYSLQFTPLPIFQIYVDSNIKNEPKIPSYTSVSMSAFHGEMIDSYMGIEYRGKSSIIYPKRAYGIEFWDDMFENGHLDVSFFNLMEDDDWILDAMYVDKSRFRNAISWDIWNDLQVTSMTESSPETRACQGGYVEVFLNGDYKGLYRLAERVDRKRLGISSVYEEGHGYLYKAKDWTQETKFQELSDLTEGLIWCGWNIKYPKEPNTANWLPLYNLIDFAVNSSDEEFKDHVFDHIDQSNLIDYLIFIHVIKGTDNFGNNVFMVKHTSGSAFYTLPWDLDATWGRDWLAGESNEKGLILNFMHRRILKLNPENFVQKYKDRWNVLKEGIVHPDNINQRIDDYVYLLEKSGAFERDSKRWPEFELNLREEQAYLKDWYQRRYEYLDAYFENLQ